jgi:hypothetical protein
MDNAALYEALRARARTLSRTIHEYLDPKMNLPDIARAKELLATLQVMDQVKREVDYGFKISKEKP